MPPARSHSCAAGLLLGAAIWRRRSHHWPSRSPVSWRSRRPSPNWPSTTRWRTAAGRPPSPCGASVVEGAFARNASTSTLLRRRTVLVVAAGLSTPFGSAPRPPPRTPRPLTAARVCVARRVQAYASFVGQGGGGGGWLRVCIQPGVQQCSRCGCTLGAFVAGGASAGAPPRCVDRGGAEALLWQMVDRREGRRDLLRQL